MEAYGFRFPDMLTCFGTESLLTYFCAAIDKSWISCCGSLLHDAKLDNKKLIRRKKKGQSGWYTARADGVEQQGSSGIPLKDVFEPGLQFGMGFQGFVDTDLIPAKTRNVYVYGHGHDPSAYDENGKCKYRDELFAYIKSNLFVPVINYEERFARIKEVQSHFLNMKV